MIRKTPKSVPLGRKVVGGVIIFEVLSFGVAYTVWHKLNKSRDFRLKAKENFPWALEKYYQLGEFIDSNNVIRKIDEKVWNHLAEQKSD